MNLIDSEELRGQLARIDQLKAEIDALRPTLTEDRVGRILQKFRLDWNYHSNSIEGNSLTYGETVAFLMEGVTAKGKPLKDHLDLRGHNAAIDFLLSLVKDDRGITEAEIRELHKLVLAEPYTVRAETAEGQATTKTIQLGLYKTSPNHVRTATGQIHYYASPEETPARMEELMAWYRAQREQLHPLVLAALFHHRFVAIHPFDDGNGRMTRLLTNLILMQHGFPPIVIKTEEKSAYYGVLSQADAGVQEPLLAYFAERLIAALELYLRGARGEDIADEDDLDKEILLLKASFDKEDQATTQKSRNAVYGVFAQSLVQLSRALGQKLGKLADMFGEYHFGVSLETDIIHGQAYRPTYRFDPETQTFKNVTYPFMSLSSFEYFAQLKDALFFFNLNFFKKATNPFDVRADITCRFPQYNYQIQWLRKGKIEKLYHLQLTQDEIDQIVKEVVLDVLDSIKRQSKQP